MSQTIKVSNFSANNILETTELVADSLAGATTVSVANSSGYANGDYVYVGAFGSESGEMKTLTATPPSAASLTISALTLPHTQHAQVVKLFGNKIKLYRANNVDGSQPDDANFAAIGSPADIDFDQADTALVDASGSSSYWYKAVYYNSTSLAETSLANATAMRGGGVGNYCTIEQIRQAAGLTTNRYVSDVAIDEKRQAAQDEVNGALVGLYVVPFTSPIPATIQDITARLAAGLLLTSPWAGNFTSTISEGNDKLDRARKDLENIQKKQRDVVVNGESIAIANVGGFSMYPDSTTDGQAPEDGGARFTSDMRY